MKIPFIVDTDSKKETVYDIYSKLLKERIIFIEGEINDETANLVVSELLYLDSISNDDINYKSVAVNNDVGNINRIIDLNKINMVKLL